MFLLGALSRFSRPLCIFAIASCVAWLPLLPSFASSHLQSPILHPPQTFLLLLDVCNPLIPLISHVLGSFLYSSTRIASFPCVPFLSVLHQLIFLPLLSVATWHPSAVIQHSLPSGPPTPRSVSFIPL